MSDNARMERDKDIPFVDLREGARGIITWAQMDGEELPDAALEMIGEARRVAEKLDEDSRRVTTVIIGNNVSKFAQQLIHHGADCVYVVEDSRLTDFQTLPFTRAMVAAIKKVNPEIAIFSASTLGRDLAPRVAAILGVGLSADCTTLDVGYYANR
ncbi:MAG: electron transfer flavoprotein subunit alpha/FixB family protein, partial [Candidatus Kariarchaeaceae archaeon]